METESMLVTQALDERDLLVKKIVSKIKSTTFVDVTKPNTEKTFLKKETVSDFNQAATSACQSIIDLIDRYNRIDAAITKSNAQETISTSYGDMTRAAAISLRNRLKSAGESGTYFEGKLVDKLERDYNRATIDLDDKKQSVERQAQSLREAIAGKDSTKKNEEIDFSSVDAYLKANTPELVDPLGAEKLIQELNEKRETLLRELDTQIKVSNATTIVKF